MAKLFDEDNVHHFWGLSPSLDLFDVLDDLPSTISQHDVLERLVQADAIHILQVRRAVASHNSSTATSNSSRLNIKSKPEMVIADWSK